MTGAYFWRATHPGTAWALVPGLSGCKHLLDFLAAKASSAPVVQTQRAAVDNMAPARALLAHEGANLADSSVFTAARQLEAGTGGGPVISSLCSNSSPCYRIAGIRPVRGVDETGSVWGPESTTASRYRSGSSSTHDQGAAGSGRRGHRWHWSRWSGGARSSSRTGCSYTGLGFGASVAVGAAAAAAFGTVLADQPGLEEAVTAAQAALQSAWGEVEEEYARVNARLPAHAPSLKGQPPTVNEVHGAVEVVVPIREGADLNAVLRELRQGLGGRGSTSYSESLYGASRTIRMEVRQPAGTLRVMMFVPPPGGSEQAQVVVAKRGAFVQEELAALKRLVAAANVTFGLDQPARSSSAQRHGLHGGTDAEAHARAMDAMFEEFARSTLQGFMAGPMQQIFSELQRGMGMPMPGEQGEEDEDGSREGGFGGAFGGFGGFGSSGGGGGPFPGLPAPPSVQHRPKGHGSGGGTNAQGHDWGSPAAARAVEQLLAMGAQVFPPGSKDKMDWGVLAGYEEQKRTIEDCLLLPLLRPDVYAKLARATRRTFANNRPRAVLFEGPPGTGKTTSARVISSQAAVPLIYLPLEAVLSKWYGQSEQQLGAVFKAAEAMGGAIIFLDELDALGGNRESGGLHEVSRRLLSVLLREMEGFDAENKRTVVIGATNRKTDLDPALLSRFDLLITFGLPDSACRQLILRQYAKQLNDSELTQLAERTSGMSGRDLRDVCEHTERRWASKIIRGEVREEDLPPLAEYLASADERASAVQRVQQQASAAGALNRLLGAAGGGGRGLPSWLTGGGSQP